MFTRIWPALAAWGAGLLHIAVAAGSPWWLLLPVSALGVAELAWGVLVLRGGRTIAPRAALAGAVAALLVSTALTVSGRMSIAPLAALAALLLYTAGAMAIELRRGRATTPRRSAARSVIGLVVGAALVAGITTPALAMTDPGMLAVPHGEMPGHH